jgi:DNA primase
MIKQETIREIQSKIDILDVVGSFVNLKKRGANYLGVCPFHNERTPSFTVSASKEIYKCFGCGKSGNAISFIMEHEKLAYAEALRWLANRYNIEIEETEYTAEQIQEKQTAESLIILNEFAKKYFVNQLHQTEEGKNLALSYLQTRGMDAQIVEKFEIGYCPENGHAFNAEALKNQFDKELLIRSGLCTQKGDSLLDNYRGRIIFPIHNINGKIVGFGARHIGNVAQGPKYINTPENEVYVKSRLLYGTFFAKQAIAKQAECLLVEGYTDVTGMHQAHIENVVASGGTSLTVDQLRIIKKYTENLTIVYDGDDAGVKAATRGLNLALEEGLLVKVVLLPNGNDPDSYAKQFGSDALARFIADNKEDIIIFQLKVLLKEAGADTNQKSKAVNTIAETIAKLNRLEDFTRRQDYIKKCSQILQIEEAGLINLVNKFARESLIKQTRQQKTEDINDLLVDNTVQEFTDDLVFPAANVQEMSFAKVLIEFGHLNYNQNQLVSDYLLTEIDIEDNIHDTEAFNLISTYVALKQNGLQPQTKDIIYHADEKIAKAASDLLQEKYVISPHFEDIEKRKIPTREDNYLTEVEKVVFNLKLRKLEQMKHENLRDMEQLNTEEQMERLLVNIEIEKMLTALTKQKTNAFINWKK